MNFPRSPIMAVPSHQELGTLFLGGEGLFLTKLTGPGKVILQSQNFGDFAGRIIGIMPKN